MTQREKCVVDVEVKLETNMNFAHLKDGKSTVSNSWIVELTERHCCYKASNSQYTQVPVVRVAKEERVLVGVGQMEYYQTPYLTHKRKADQELKGIETTFIYLYSLQCL